MKISESLPIWNVETNNTCKGGIDGSWPWAESILLILPSEICGHRWWLVLNTSYPEEWLGTGVEKYEVSCVLWVSFSHDYSIIYTNLLLAFFHLIYIGKIPNHPKQSYLSFSKTYLIINNTLVVSSFFLLPIML